MNGIRNTPRQPRKDEQYEPKYDYGSPISVGQQKIFDALVGTMELRDDGRALALETSLPLLKVAIDEHLQSINDPDARERELQWINEEFRVYRESFRFGSDEIHMYDSFLERINLDYQTKSTE